MTAWIVCAAACRVAQHLDDAIVDDILLGGLNDDTDDVVNTGGVAARRGRATVTR
ncbi:MAG: hypothetical protein QGF90_15845 [Gammaproteobacteria bacterium]|nr:hypothetical protein [Gammaproteobacteria bacterium]